MHLQPQWNITLKCVIFKERRQHEGESFDEFFVFFVMMQSCAAVASMTDW